MTTNPTTDRLREAARRAHRLLCDLIADSSDPGTEALAARFELEQALANTAPVSSPSAARADDRAGLRERIRRAICEAEGFAWDSDMLEPDEYGEVADMVLAVLQPAADRGAVLTEAERTMLTYALDQAQEKIWSEDGFTDEDQAAVNSLRRMADEAQQQPDTETPDPGACGHRSSDGHPCNEPPGHLGFHRNARQGGNECTTWVGDGPVIEEEEMCSAEPPEGWPGDCWCTLIAGHEGPHRCEPCSNRHDAPGWSDEPTPAGGAGGVADEEQPETQAPAKPVVGYSGKGRVWCLSCPRPVNEDVPVTVGVLQPGECCAGCGRDVVDVARAVVPQPGKEA